MIKKIIVSIVLLAIAVPALANNTYERYFIDTFNGLEGLRNPHSALVVDSAYIDLTVLNDNTSPSNIGLDLLVQLEALSKPELMVQAAQNIRRGLKSIESLAFHEPTGLFYNRYSSDGQAVTHFYVSSVDNIHLAFALWVTSQIYPEAPYQRIAERLFKRLNFQPLYNSNRGLFSGGMYLHNGKWQLEGWHYDYFGSEGRSLYSIGHAIGLFQDENFPQKSVQSLQIDMYQDLLRMWDGGAFQLLLPRLLVKEEMYSVRLAKAFHAYARYVLDQKIEKDLPVPASFSACQTSVTDYNGKAGSPGLVAKDNVDINDPYLLERWDQVFTPHAAFLAAPILPNEFEQAMLDTEDLGLSYNLYMPGVGWLDGLHVKGKDKGHVVPVFLSLDQGMIALSLAQILSPDQMTVGNRVLWENVEVRNRMLKFYRLIDQAPVSFY
jgi:hypothetical protein